jgi:AcrR family transcriptional regulator
MASARLVERRPVKEAKIPKKTKRPRTRAPASSGSAASSGSSSPRVRERLETDERRDQLVRLGVDLFSARTYDDVSIDELARAAGISKGLLYHYFPTKRDFYVATVREGSRQLLERTATPDSMPPIDRLRGGLDAYLDYVEAHGPAYAALLRGGIGSDPEVARIVDETRDAVCERVMHGVPVDAAQGPLFRVMLRAWVGFVETASLDWVEKRSVTRDALRDLMTNVLLSAAEVAVRMEGGSK